MKHKKNGKIDFYSLKGIAGLEIVRGENVINEFPEHIHRKYCIGIIEQGSAVLVKKQREILLSKDDIYFINPGEPHSMRNSGQDSFCHIVFLFSEEFCRYFFEENSNSDKRVAFTRDAITSPKTAAEFRALFEHILRVKSPLEREYLIMTAISGVFAFMACSGYDKRTKNTGIEAVCEYIRQNQMEELSLERLAEIAHLSRFHFSRVFKKEVGISPYSYQLQVKIKSAGEMLLGGSSISETAYKYGFADQSHFTRFFKKNTGITPAQFIQNNISL